MHWKLGQNATTQVYITEVGQRQIVTNKEDIEQVCMMENEAQFSQSEGTPLMTEPLLSDIGYFANGPKVEDILNGTYIAPDGLDPYATKLMELL